MSIFKYTDLEVTSVQDGTRLLEIRVDHDPDNDDPYILKPQSEVYASERDICLMIAALRQARAVRKAG